MNEELQKQLATIVKKAIEVAEQTGEFVIDQAPLLLQEFYTWHTFRFSFGIFLGLIAMILAYILHRAELKACRDPHDSYDYFDAPERTAPMITFTVVGSVLFFINIYKLAFVLIAPKIYLIEYFLK